ncbi:uncharacterized protein DUF742 [Actinocorallia herbida]|uniref:Uncharacterized protein DUF742 n=1 Tax=Actinocorallia herbida TaxID=58109 RepID=A0A3N1DCJ8_9ACTN|nr:DUF742 domain-containing protein [Actinocorallia herbida]ROO91237.1 uncharacterized protein DUF742 [Actinocorallia herbida]
MDGPRERGPKERWVGRDAGPLVRPYTITRGRTRTSGIRLDLVTILVATWNPVRDHMRLTSEQHRLLAMCRKPITIADLASEIDLPLKVVHVLLGDLCEHGLLQEVPQQQQTPTGRHDARLLMRVLNGLREL